MRPGGHDLLAKRVSFAPELCILVRRVPIIAGSGGEPVHRRRHFMQREGQRRSEIERESPQVAKVFGAAIEKASRISPIATATIAAMKLKNSPYCARLDQPGRGGATAQPRLRGLQDAAELLFLERPAGSKRDAGERIFGDGHRKPGFVAKHLVETL
jgi:hypothetical protein